MTKLRMLTATEITIMHDLAEKACTDALRASLTAYQLATEHFGAIGVACVALECAYAFLVNAAAALHLSRTGKTPRSEEELSNDDLYFCSLLAVTMQQEGMNSTNVARDLFLKAMRRDIDLPEAWQKPLGKTQ